MADEMQVLQEANAPVIDEPVHSRFSFAAATIEKPTIEILSVGKVLDLVQIAVVGGVV